MTIETARTEIVGRGIPLPGNDIDTDRIIPARFLKAVTFEGLGEHAFEDARKQDPEHPFNQKAYEGASILVAGLNFGCGSSREHAPESLKRWGVKAIVAGSFAEIFFGNCTTLGIPCLTAAMDDVLWLQRTIGRDPSQPVIVDVKGRTVRVGDRTIPVQMPDGPHHQLVSGTWNAMNVLLEAGNQIEATANRLPYIKGFKQ
jgi:3-isopropylmalate/(R)-2-methylmalate dehydratase small subunit